MLTEAAIFLAAALVAVPLFRRLKLGAVLGYLGAGMLIGPAGLGLVGDAASVLHGAEIGVVFLLFVIGLELKPSRLWLMRRAIFGAGSLQLFSAAVPLALLLHFVLDLSLAPALVVGLALGLSSTAFVLQALAERKQLTAPHGRAAFGILLFQDLAVIPLLALLPLLGSGAADGGGPAWSKALQSLLIVIGFVAGGRYLLRPVLRAVARWGSEETFTVAALLVVIGSALLLDWAGLSMGLGAFLAGVLLADSEYRHELEANINPFKGLLLGLFFIAVGMSANFGLLLESPGFILSGALALIAIKAISLWLCSRAQALPEPTAMQLALVLAQGGEFAFVVFHAAGGQMLLAPELMEQLTAMVIVSMLLTPLLFLAADAWGRRCGKEEPEPRFDTITNAEPPVIICGFGRVGQMVGRVLHMRGIHFTALERDAAHVDLVRRWGNKVYYGDPTNLETLRAAGAAQAKAIIVALDETESSIRCVELVRRHFPHLKVFARARNRLHNLHLMDLGVDYAIRETWPASLELARELLVGLGDTTEAAAYSVEVFRDADAELLQRQLKHRDDLDQMIQTAQDVRAELQTLFEQDPQMSALTNRPGAKP